MLFRSLERAIPESHIYAPSALVEQFDRAITSELDFRGEAENALRFAENFAGDPDVRFPRVHRDASGRFVLTLEFLHGRKIYDALAAGFDRGVIAQRAIRVVIKQILEDGFFHADPHPGNIFVLPGNVICLIDFGMTGAVDRATREAFVRLVEGVIRRDEPRTAEILLKLTEWDEEPNRTELEKDVADFLGRHLYRPLGEIQFSKLMQHMLEVATKNRMRILPDIFLMLKALSQVENIARELYPDFDMIQAVTPFIRDVKVARLAPGRLMEDVVRLIEQSYEFLTDFPKDLLEISHSLRQKKMSFTLVLKDLDKMLATHDQISNRISFAIIIAALIIGSALIVISRMPPMVYGISLIGLIGFLAAGFLGVWLLVAIIKKGRL